MYYLVFLVDLGISSFCGEGVGCAGFSGNCSEVLLDLYSGTGTIALFLASQCKEVYGVESNQHAVDDAMGNARSNSIRNACFLQADLSEYRDIAHVAERVPRPDIVIAGAF